MKRAILLICVLLGGIPLGTYAATNSTIQCYDDYVLEENITVYVDGNVSTATLWQRCPNGCDNTTLSCNPDKFNQDIIIILTFVGIVVSFFIVVYIVKRL